METSFEMSVIDPPILGTVPQRQFCKSELLFMESQHCKNCDKLYNRTQVKASLGDDSLALLGGYCSAFCYTEDFLENSGITDIANLASHGVSVIKYWMDETQKMEARWTGIMAAEKRLRNNEMASLIDGIDHAVNDHPHVINVEKIESLLNKYKAILKKYENS